MLGAPLMNRQPVNRCAERGCPMIGHWPEGRWCPMHAPDREADEALLRLQPQPEPEPDTYQPLDGLPPQTAAAVERYRQLKEQR